MLTIPVIKYWYRTGTGIEFDYSVPVLEVLPVSILLQNFLVLITALENYGVPVFFDGIIHSLGAGDEIVRPEGSQRYQCSKAGVSQSKV